jgi:predicted DNA-binding antitoxin AbrB/MazE fold protein
MLLKIPLVCFHGRPVFLHDVQHAGDSAGFLEIAWNLMGGVERANLVTRGHNSMAQVTEAIYTHGVLKLKEELALRESQRVRLIVEPLDDDAGREDRSVALRRLPAGIEGMKFFSREPLPSRDELHDRP